MNEKMTELIANLVMYGALLLGLALVILFTLWVIAGILATWNVVIGLL